VLIGSFFELLMLPLFAVPSDSVGLKLVAFFGTLWTALFSYPFFWIIRGGTLLDISAAISLAMVGICALFAVLPAYVSSLFEAKVRYTGSSLAYGIGAGLVGGLTPLLASSLYLWSISSWPIALYLVGISVISIVVVIASPGSWTRSGTINHLFVAVTEK
jgi:MFS transporter, MHS family, shikimate and dehydroshikimate transport protein